MASEFSIYELGAAQLQSWMTLRNAKLAYEKSDKLYADCVYRDWQSTPAGWAIRDGK